MKILHVVSSITQESGVMNEVMNYYRYLYDYGVCFDFIYFKKFKLNYEQEIKDLGGRTIYCSSSNSLLTVLAIKEKVNEIQNKYDAIEIHELYMSSIIGTLDIPVILHSHTVKYAQTKLSEIRNRFLCRSLGKYGDFFVSCSLDSAKIFWPEKLKDERFRIIRNAICEEKYSFSKDNREIYRARYQFNKDDIIMGYVARFDYGKNHIFLLEILKQIIADGEIKYKLLLVGDGPCSNIIKKFVNSNNLAEFVCMPGKISNSEIKNYLSMCDIYLFPSSNEGLGISLIEAQCNKLKCVVAQEISDEAQISSGYEKIKIKTDEGDYNLSEWKKAVYRSDFQRQIFKFSETGYEIEKESIGVLTWYEWALSKGKRILNED